MIKNVLGYFSTAALPAVFLAVIGSGVAKANLISVIGPLTATTVSNGGTWSVTLPKFTPIDGQTLLGVTIYYETTIQLNSVTISNNTTNTRTPSLDVNAVYGFLNSANHVDVFTAEQLRVGTPAGQQQKFTVVGKATNASPPLSTTFTQNLGPTLKNITSFANGTGLPLVTSNGVGGLQAIALQGTSLSQYMASGTDTSFVLSGSAQVDFKGTTSPIGTGGNGGLVITGWTGTQDVQVEVDYTYTPEPATMGLIGSSLIGLAMLRRRFAR